MDVKEGEIGSASAQDAKKFIESSPDGNELSESKKQTLLIEKCSKLVGFFDALYEETKLAVIEDQKETYVISDDGDEKMVYIVKRSGKVKPVSRPGPGPI